MKYKSLNIIAALWLMVGGGVWADNVRFTASAPSAVANGQQFRLTYTVNAEAKDLRVGDFGDAFDVLMGPSTSRSSSYQIVNGQTSSQTSLSFTYVLMATQEGTYTIPPATITAGGEKLTSNSLTIKILKSDQAAHSSSRSSDQSSSTKENTSSSAAVNSDNIFILAHVSKQNVYEQEQIVVSYKLYTKLDFVGFENAKFPEFKDFLSQEIVLPENRQFTLENYNGSNYKAVLLKQTILFPQKAGSLSVEPGQFDVVVRVRNQRQVRSIFDDFFDTYQDVRKTLRTPSVKINVKELPSNKPASFNGAVGDFKITSSISSDKVKENEAITIKLTVSGNGNLKLIKTPEIQYPADFEIYDPKVDNKFHESAAGVSGSKTFEYLAIPRYAGTFEIPAITFSYFDTRSKSYKTLQAGGYSLQVAKSSGGSSSTAVADFSTKEDIKFLGKDIRYLKKVSPEGLQTDGLMIVSWYYWLWYIVPLIAFLVLFIIFRQQAKENANVALMKNKKANKIALKRMKSGYKFMQKGDKGSFYEEVLRALWGYISDKLNIPVAQLSKDNVEAELSASGADTDLIRSFMDVLDSCEFARYAPVELLKPMNEVYDLSIDVISKMENSIKR